MAPQTQRQQHQKRRTFWVAGQEERKLFLPSGKGDGAGSVERGEDLEMMMGKEGKGCGREETLVQVMSAFSVEPSNTI